MSSFSAVSTPIFASKYSLESSRRDLHNALLCTALESIIEKWGKKDLAKTTPKKGENKKTRGHEAVHNKPLRTSAKGASRKNRARK